MAGIRILMWISVLTSAVLPIHATAKSVDLARRAEELKALKWGMFICWSFSTFSGREWTPGVIDVSFFKATGCDTDQWARTAREAGMGYILFLTKHHDGFCLWDTKTTDRNVTKSPLGRDVLAELRKSCDRYGLKLALYFSEGDWTWPGATDGQGGETGGGKNPEMKKAQLRELLTQYGPIEYLWFDHAVGDGGLSHAQTIAFCKALQPGCFVGFNHGDQQGADIRLGELGRPGLLDDRETAGPYLKDAPSRSYRLAEFTYPILPPHQGGARWFYSLPIHDALCHPAEKLYHDYVGAVRFGNIFSLDVGPDYSGRLREVDAQTLRRVGEMIRRKAPDPGDSAVAKPGDGHDSGNLYYVGGVGASDHNSGTASQPFATIQKAARVAVAGDFISIRAGTYRETITPANSGTPAHPITFQPDGNAVVKVRGADPAEGGWTAYSGHVYQKTIALPVTGYQEQITGNTTLLANQVFVGGKMMIEARWPNVANSDDLLNRADFRPVAKGAWTTKVGTTLRDAGIPDIPGSWTGGTIWFIGWYQPQSSTITASAAGQIQFPATAPEKFHDSYYLTGRLGALDAEKEWFYDGTKLYLWAPGGGSPEKVEVKQRNYAFDLRGKSHVTIKHIRIFAATIMTDSNSTNITLDGLNARYVSHFVTVHGLASHRTETGLRLMGANSVIRNSLVEYSAGVGIALGGADALAENNLVHDISYGGTYGCGIWPAPGRARQTIMHNTICRTGRSGIDGVYSNKDIGYNDIYDFGLINTDLGAIYAANGADLTGTRVHHNWLHDAKNDASHQFPVGAGIYFDQNAKPAQVDHNVFWNNHKNDVRLEQGSAPFHRVFNNTMASTEPDFWYTFHSYPVGSPSNSQNNIYREAIKPDAPGSNEMTSGIDPRFAQVGEGGLRYRLQPDSPAIDRGAVISGVTDGYVGSAPDLGAYEYGGTDWVAGCSVLWVP